MAALGLVYFPPTASLCLQTHFLIRRPPPLPCLFSPPLKHAQRFNLQLVPAAQVGAAEPIVPSETSEENSEEEDEASRTKLLVQNVPWTYTADDLRPLFEKYGSVTGIEFSMYNKSRNRGLAFVTMGSHEEALAALNSLESSEFEGRVLRLNWAKPKKKKPAATPQPKPLPVHNLFVANLPFQGRAKGLKELFIANNANAVSAEIIFHENPRRSAGYGFVSFNTKAEAEAALTALQGKEFMGRPIRVAHSRRFLRDETKAAVKLESAEVT